MPLPASWTTTRSTTSPPGIAKDNCGSSRARADHVRSSYRQWRLGVRLFFDYGSSCAAVLYESYSESGVGARGIGDQWIRPLHQPQEHLEHLVARGAHSDRPPDRRLNRQLYSLPRSSSVGKVCDLLHAVAIDSAPSCRH